MGAPDWPPTPVGAIYTAPYCQPYPLGIEGKEKLGAPDWPPKPVGNICKAPNFQPSTMGIDGTVSNKRKAVTVGQCTPVWIMHAERKLQQGSAPNPPGRYWPGLKPTRHSTGETVTGAITNLHLSENKQIRRKFKDEQGTKSYWNTH